jgi:hypothetical protein
MTPAKRMFEIKKIKSQLQYIKDPNEILILREKLSILINDQLEKLNTISLK